MSSISSSFSTVSLPSAVNSGLATLSAAGQRLNQDAQQIANPANENPTNPLLDLKQSSLSAEAGAAVIRASNEMLGSLLDVFA
jgi:hypothetical protein